MDMTLKNFQECRAAIALHFNISEKYLLGFRRNPLIYAADMYEYDWWYQPIERDKNSINLGLTSDALKLPPNYIDNIFHPAVEIDWGRVKLI